MNTAYKTDEHTDKALQKNMQKMDQLSAIRESDLNCAYEMNFHLVQLCRSFAQEKEFWQSMYYEIQNSTSWKITKPLRLFIQFIRRNR